MELEILKTSLDLEDAFKKWGVLIYKYVYVRLKNKENAEDITQEVFMKAWQYKESFDSEKASLKTWLFIITINLIRDFFRKNKISFEELEENVASKENLEKEAHTKDLIDFVFDQIKHLSEKEQEMLVLRYQADLSIKEIAKLLEMEDSATKVAIHRAVKKLKDFCNKNPEKM